MTSARKDNDEKNIRPPIVVILGHVDHGKTTILDAIRKTKVAQGEAGGITQHIGAYQAVERGKTITFLDTPGHEAFSAIRLRGVKVADIAVLVVAGDEGIKPQTKEAINIINETKTTFLVAINKIDKDGANPQRVKQELAEAGVFVEGYGGKTPIVEMSAKSGKGLDELLEVILLIAELEELKYSPNVPARGIVIESHLDSRRGVVATLLPLDGNIKLGDFVAAGGICGRVKALENFSGKTVTSATASDPVVMLGWDEAPGLGEEFTIEASRDEAEKKTRARTTLGPKNLFLQERGAKNTNKKTLKMIIKADVASSLEAIDQVLKSIKSEEVNYSVTSYGIGSIGDSDIKSAVATGSTIIGFHVSIDQSLANIAERERVMVKTFDVIYELVEFVRQAMSDLLDPEIKKIPLGKLKVLAIFKKETKYQIVGGKVVSGKVIRGALADVIRSGAVIAIGRVSQLQSGKVDMPEVAEGFEAGIKLDLSATRQPTGIPVVVKEGDILEIYQEEKIKRSI